MLRAESATKRLCNPVEWTESLFPEGSNYSCGFQIIGSLHQALSRQLRLDIHGHGPAGLWGETAVTVARAGLVMAWVMDDEAPAFFSWTVRDEVARAAAAGKGHLRPGPSEFAGADELLAALEMTHLSDRAPDRLSDGETKLLLLALGWVKSPRWLFMDSLTRSLSEQSVHRVLDFWSTQSGRPVLILGDGPMLGPFKSRLESLGAWQVVDDARLNHE